MSCKCYPIVLPELGLGPLVMRASVWLTRPGTHVVEGDRILEIVAGDVTVDLPAPASGRLSERYVCEDDALHTGQVLGMIEVSDERERFS
jgi:pyruvate/2-oxoglutarate dehydrogenase complex dihydrolipoamide acyltransferase (E2) component